MIEKVTKLIEKPLNDENIKLCSVSYVKEGTMYFLRIMIDKEPFVDVDTCVTASNIINPLIDTMEDDFDQSYILDVCSKEEGE